MAQLSLNSFKFKIWKKNWILFEKMFTWSPSRRLKDLVYPLLNHFFDQKICSCTFQRILRDSTTKFECRARKIAAKPCRKGTPIILKDNRMCSNEIYLASEPFWGSVKFRNESRPIWKSIKFRIGSFHFFNKNETRSRWLLYKTDLFV